MREYADAGTAVILTGLAALVVWLLGLADIADVPPAVAAAIAGILVSLGLAVKNRGIKGIAKVLWAGNHSEKKGKR